MLRSVSGYEYMRQLVFTSALHYEVASVMDAFEPSQTSIRWLFLTVKSHEILPPCCQQAMPEPSAISSPDRGPLYEDGIVRQARAEHPTD